MQRQHGKKARQADTVRWRRVAAADRVLAQLEQELKKLVSSAVTVHCEVVVNFEPFGRDGLHRLRLLDLQSQYMIVEEEANSNQSH